jgi:hypothetical protein
MLESFFKTAGGDSAFFGYRLIVPSIEPLGISFER